MSEKIYAWLLSLYPSHFREKYGDEALQLLRDRARDETGFFRTLRLWLDLFADLVISIPREYRYVRPALAGSVVQQRLAGGPSFFVLEDGSSRLRAFCVGGIVSLTVLTMSFALLIRVGGQRTVGAATRREVAAGSWRSDSAGSATPKRAGVAKAKSSVLGLPPRSRVPPTVTAAALPFSSPSPLSIPAAPRQSNEQSPTLAAAFGAKGDAQLDAEERRRVVDHAAANLKQFYFDKDVAQKTADALLAHEKNGDDNGRRKARHLPAS